MGTRVNFLMGLPYISYLRQDAEKKNQLTDCLDVGAVSMAGMAQMLVRLLFFDSKHPNMKCIYKTHKSTRAWVHTTRGFWVQVENAVFVTRVTEWMDSALSGHLYIDGFDPMSKKDTLEQLRNACLQYGLARTALSIEDVVELPHVAPEDLQFPLTNKQRQEYEDILLDYVLRLSRCTAPPQDMVIISGKNKAFDVADADADTASAPIDAAAAIDATFDNAGDDDECDEDDDDNASV